MVTAPGSRRRLDLLFSDARVRGLTGRWGESDGGPRKLLVFQDGLYRSQQTALPVCCDAVLIHYEGGFRGAGGSVSAPPAPPLPQ